MTSNVRRLAWIVGAILVGIIVSLSAAILWRSASPPPHYEYVLTLVPARDYQPLVHPYELKTSRDFMILQQHVAKRDIAQPVSYPSPDPEAVEFGCGLLIVVIGPDRRLSLNSSDLGTLDDPTPLVTKLSDVFRQRVEQRYYRRGLETRSNMAAIERIERTVLLRPSESASYGDVVRLLEILKQLHADPIGLQVDHLQIWSSTCPQAIEQIVGRERRGRVSQVDSSGDAWLNSRRRVNSAAGLLLLYQC